MQEQQRPARAAFDHLEGSSGDGQHLAHRGIIAETCRGFQAALARHPPLAIARNTTKIAISPQNRPNRKAE
jgi:hypothetical protein